MKSTIKRILPKNSFARSVSVLSGGTVAAQSIVILASPLLTRLYTPEHFGVLAVYSALLAVITVVASLRYELVIPLPEDDDEASHVVALSLLVVLVMTLFCIAIVFFFRRPIVEVLNIPDLAAYFYLLPLGLLLAGTYQVFNYWAIRTTSFMAIARTRLSQSLTVVIVQLCGHSLGPLMLILGRILGQIVGIIGLGGLALRYRWEVLKKIKPAGILRAAGRYKNFPIYSSWAGISNSAGRELPPLLFAALFSTSAAGFYMLANRVLAMPTILIGRAIADVFYSQASRAHRKGDLAVLVAGVHEKLTHIAMPPALILVFAGPDLFALTFGNEWRQAGEFARLFAPFLYINFITSPLSTLDAVFEKQAKGALFYIILLTIRVLALIVGSYYQNVMLAVALFALGSTMCWIGFLFWLVRLTGNRLITIVIISGRAFLLGMFLTTPLAIVTLTEQKLDFWFIGLVATFTLIVARYLYLMRKAWE